MTEKTQRERFEETARQLECDEDEAKFNDNLKKIARKAEEDMRIGPKETLETFTKKVASLEVGQGALVPADLFEKFFDVPMDDPLAGEKAKAFAKAHGVETQPRRDHNLVAFYKK